MKLLLVIACALLSLPVPPMPSTAQDKAPDFTSIAEEQEHLRRQVQRLRRTMEALIPRLEQQGQTRNLALLRAGLEQLDQRAAETRSLTLDELMDSARSSAAAGQAAVAVEQQQAVVRALERLLALLLERESLDRVDDQLGLVREIKQALSELASREAELERQTQALREQSSNPAQKALDRELERMIEKQRELLARNEALGRESGSLALEQLERELDELIRDQAIDQAVIEGWQPADQQALEALRPALEQARAELARSARLRQAAGLLRQSAERARAAGRDDDLESVSNELDEAADREDRRSRAAGDDASKQAATALESSAQELRQAGNDAAARAEAADAMERRAGELEQAAAAGEQSAQESTSELTPELASLAQKPSGAGQAARDAQTALEKAARNSAGKPQESAEATERALSALNQALEDEKRLGPALAESQRAAAERAERVGRGVESLPRAGEDPDLGAARAELARASAALRAAGDSARREDAAQAAQSAESASEALAKARAAMQSARKQGAERSAREGGEAASKIASEQQALAQEAQQAGEQASQGSMEASASESVQRELDGAREAMEQAAREMRSGQSSSAAGSQNRAREALQRARDQAREGVRPQSADDVARAQELAKTQEEIKRELLELATRNQKRPGAEGQENLQRAAQSAQKAQDSLSEGELGTSEEHEQDVQRELEQAQEDLEREEDQYQRLRQDELLFRIQEELASLLKSHQQAMKETAEIDAARESAERPSRAQRVRLKNIARDEAALAARAGELAKAIADEQSLVFAETLAQMRQDLERVARDLDEAGDWQTDESVRGLQRDVEERALWLLETLKEERERREKQQQQQQGQQQQRPEQENRLVPDSAELKLLRRLDVDVVERINHLLEAYPDLGEAEADPLLLDEVQRLAERHERVTRLFGQFRQRLGLPDPGKP